MPPHIESTQFRERYPLKRLPIWLVTVLLLLGILTIAGGWYDRAEVGYIPFVLGILWVLFALAAAPRVFADD